MCAQVGRGLGGDGGDFAVAAVIRAVAFGAGFDLFVGVARLGELFAARELGVVRRGAIGRGRRRQCGVVGGDVGRLAFVQHHRKGFHRGGAALAFFVGGELGGEVVGVDTGKARPRIGTRAVVAPIAVFLVAGGAGTGECLAARGVAVGKGNGGEYEECSADDE